MSIDINKLRQLAQGTNEHSDDRAEILAEFYAATQSDTIIELLDRLEAAEKKRDWHAERCEDAMNECATLRSKIEQMEKQEPVAWYSKQYGFVYMSRQPSQFEHGSILYLRNGAPAWRIEGSSKVALLDIASLPHGTVFYALPGAQTQGEEK